MQIKLGQKLRCKVTGFEGIATARIEYINGCVQYCVKPKCKDKNATPPAGEYIDAQQLEVIGQGVCVETKGTGGPASTAPQVYRG